MVRSMVYIFRYSKPYTSSTCIGEENEMHLLFLSLYQGNLNINKIP